MYTIFKGGHRYRSHDKSKIFATGKDNCYNLIKAKNNIRNVSNYLNYECLLTESGIKINNDDLKKLQRMLRQAFQLIEIEKEKNG